MKTTKKEKGRRLKPGQLSEVALRLCAVLEGRKGRGMLLCDLGREVDEDVQVVINHLVLPLRMRLVTKVERGWYAWVKDANVDAAMVREQRRQAERRRVMSATPRRTLARVIAGEAPVVSAFEEMKARRGVIEQQLARAAARGLVK
jgi:hypothetical protein